MVVNTAGSPAGRLGLARCRGLMAIGDARVIPMSAAVSYRDKGLYVATFRRRKVPDWSQFGWSLVSLDRSLENCNVALMRELFFCLS